MTRSKLTEIIEAGFDALVDEATARQLLGGISKTSLWRLTHSGELPKVGGGLYRLSDINAYVGGRGAIQAGVRLALKLADRDYIGVVARRTGLDFAEIEAIRDGRREIDDDTARRLTRPLTTAETMALGRIGRVIGAV